MSRSRSLETVIALALAALFALPAVAQTPAADPTPPAAPEAPVAASAAPPANKVALLEMEPPSLEGLEESVKAQLLAGEKALSTAETTDPVELASRFGELGHLYHAYEQWTPAAIAYENARRLDPDNLMWTYSMAVVAYKRGELDAAAPLFQAVAEKAPGFPSPRLYLAEIALQAGQAAAARELVAPLVQANLSPAAQTALGRALMAEGKSAEAAAAFRGALDQVPEATRLHYLLGMALRAQGDAAGAAAELAKAGTVGVKIPDPLDALLAGHRGGFRVPLIEGDTAMKANRPADALAAYQRALAAKPNDAEIVARIAVAQAAMGDVAAAEASLRRALELEPASTGALFNLGMLLGQKGDTAGALKALNELLEIEPRHLPAHRLVGMMLAATGDREGALKHLLPLVKADPDDEEIRFRVAVLLVDLTRFAEARDLLAEGLARNAKALRLARAQARILATAPDLALRDGIRAVELAEQVYMASSQPGDLELLAQALAESGRCSEASVSYRLLAADEKEAARQKTLQDLSDKLGQAKTCRP